MPHTLYAIAFSHYVEKARWTLDRFGISYEQSLLLPFFHIPAVAWAVRGRPGKADKTSSPFSTPLLVLDDGQVLRTSTAISKWVDTHFAKQAGQSLYHSPEVAKLEQRFHDRLGPHTRRMAYWYLLPQRTLMRDIARRNVGAAQATAFGASLPLLGPVMARTLGVNRPAYERSCAKLDALLDETDQMLKGRSYLVGDHLTAADISLATLLSPMLRPPPYGSNMPPLDTLPKGLRAHIEATRNRPTGQWALERFAQERLHTL